MPTELELRSHAARGPEVYGFRTAAGLLSPEEFRPAELLLLDAADPAADAHIFVPQANYGVVGTVLAALAPDGRTLLTETSARAADHCEANLARNGVSNATVALADGATEIEGADLAAITDFDVAAYAPKPYEPTAVVRWRIADALASLRAGGDLFVAAGETDGGKRYRRTMADLAGGVETVASSGDVSVYRASRPEGFDRAHVLAESAVEEREISATVRGVTCEFATRPGLFSWTGLDDGTRALLDALDVADGERVLDCCCGYGPVGVFAASFADCEVSFTDDDCVATAFARRNAERNGVEPARVVTADGVSGVADQRFDVVAANPPTHAGREVTDDIFAGVRDALVSGGRFLLVYNAVLGYEERLSGLFDSVEVVSEVDSYRVAMATKG